jgi:acyl-CoA synthetase (AMP-forming)/AMP-acid ligase II
MTLTVPFIEAHKGSDALALSDENSQLSYRELYSQVQAQCRLWRTDIAISRPVILLIAHPQNLTVVQYLVAHTLDWVVLLLHPETTADIRQNYCHKLGINVIIDGAETSVLHSGQHTLAADLRLLLSTSGSTGAGKCVALSLANLQANCQSIIDYLPMTAQDITLATLPLSYSYGLSVLHTHLHMGAQLVFTPHSVFDKGFWQQVKALPVTSLAGVPSFYDMLLRLRFTRMELPALRYFTQAGGKLASTQVNALVDYAKRLNKRFFVMYGQTEATARMAFIDDTQLGGKPDSIGRAIPGGELTLRDNEGRWISSRNTPGELCFRGDNVMLGYVESLGDMASFTPIEWLATGDMAEIDDDGDYKIVGRYKRMIKVYGERVNLDALEQQFMDDGFNVKCCGQDNLLGVFCLVGEQGAVAEYCRQSFRLNKAAIQIQEITEWPLLSNGKVNYLALNQMLLQGGESAANRV